MLKIIAFGASYSKESINRRFATYAAAQFEGAKVELLDLNHYQLPLFTVDLEKEIGHPEAAHEFVAKLQEADLLVISMSEHNGSYTAAFKNLFDWASRVEVKMFANAKMLLLSTAPGPHGGLSVLDTAKQRFPRHGAEICASFSLPRFRDNFDPELGITDESFKTAFKMAIAATKESIETMIND
ncbi:MAG: NADPH-dependent FMN reductase [Saprospiraceae bacterium]